jgi:hypothetical protein
VVKLKGEKRNMEILMLCLFVLGGLLVLKEFID